MNQSNASSRSNQIILAQTSKARALAETAIRNLGIDVNLSTASLTSIVIRHRFELDDVEQLLVIRRDFGTRLHEIIRLYDAGLELEYISYLGALRANLADYHELGTFKNSLRSLHRFISFFRLADLDPEDAASAIATAHRRIKKKLPWIKGLRESIKILQFAAGDSDCELTAAIEVIVQDDAAGTARQH